MLETETLNSRTRDIDRLDTLEILRLINQEDQRVAPAVQEVLPLLAVAVERIATRLQAGGRLFYVGAGTSGRLGILDAVECPPTYGVPPDLVRGVLAGGYEACHRSLEAAEDNPEQGARDLQDAGVSSGDAVVGIAASGRTPYTLGAVRHARQLGALTVGISCNRNTPLSREAEIAVEVDTGPEVIAGSTRMKAGTAQKMILNLISTTCMIRLGHVYGNLMVNLHLKNRKLWQRGVAMITEITGVSRQDAERALKSTGDVQQAVVCLKLGCTPREAQRLLKEKGNLRKVLEES